MTLAASCQGYHQAIDLCVFGINLITKRAFWQAATLIIFYSSLICGYICFSLHFIGLNMDQSRIYQKIWDSTFLFRHFSGLHLRDNVVLQAFYHPGAHAIRICDSNRYRLKRQIAAQLTFHPFSNLFRRPVCDRLRPCRRFYFAWWKQLLDFGTFVRNRWRLWTFLHHHSIFGRWKLASIGQTGWRR